MEFENNLLSIARMCGKGENWINKEYGENYGSEICALHKSTDRE